MGQKQILGKYGEDVAASFLQDRGYSILERNWRCEIGEIDLIAQHKESLVFVEVKTRSTNYFEEPQDAVKPKKIKLLLSAIDYYVIEKDLDVEVRFDIIAIIHQNKQTKITHLEDAFLHF